MSLPTRNKSKRRKLPKSLSSPEDRISTSLRYERSHKSLDDDYAFHNRQHIGLAQSFRESISNGTARFFGISQIQQPLSTSSAATDSHWIDRRLRYMTRRYGNLNEEFVRKQEGNELDEVILYLQNIGETGDNFRDVEAAKQGTPESIGRSASFDSRVNRFHRFERRESVVKMTWDGVVSAIQRGSIRNESKRRINASLSRNRSASSSFSPFSIHSSDITPRALNTKEVSQKRGSPTSYEKELPSASTLKSSLKDFNYAEVGPSSADSKKSAYSSAYGYGMSTVFEDDEGDKDVTVQVQAVANSFKRCSKDSDAHKSSKELQQESADFLWDEVFFDADTDFRYADYQGEGGSTFDFETKTQPFNEINLAGDDFRIKNDELSATTVFTTKKEKEQKVGTPRDYFDAHGHYSFPQHIEEKFVNHLKTNVKYRQGIGFGIWKKFFRREMKHIDQGTIEKLDCFHDYRPFFTYWVTSVQILVTVISIIIYGFGPYGFERIERTADVLHSSVTLKHVSIYEQGNFWLGPSFIDLIHLGAKYSPCMRHDEKIFKQIEEERNLERETGCCIYNDGTGCFQTSYTTCPKLIATWVKWKNGSRIDKRLSGAVCGQDPSYCEHPSSVDPFEWPDDITQWPICQQPAAIIPESEKHLLCEITGRPCCIQLHGQCRITTRDYCDFVRGYFHENATLCSQVSCLGRICGMLPFLDRNRPDQIYRIFISLLLHAGIIHCLLSVFIQWCYMRDLEKLIGWARMAILYIGSGIAGNLASAIFVPYKPEAGPAGSHIGIFAAMFTDIVYNWKLILEPWRELRKLILFVLFLFLIGVLPWIDNWAHLFSLIIGFLISLATFPYIQLRKNDRTRRMIIVVVSLAFASGIFFVLLTAFYASSGFECSICEYFNCLPFTDHFCDDQGLHLKSWLPI